MTQDNGASLRDRALVNGASDESPPKASITSADELVVMMVEWGSIPSAKFNERYPAFQMLKAKAHIDWDLDETPEGAWSAALAVFCEIAESIHANSPKQSSENNHD